MARDGNEFERRQLMCRLDVEKRGQFCTNRMIDRAPGGSECGGESDERRYANGGAFNSLIF